MKIATRQLTSTEEVAGLKRAYLSALTAPLDGMWEAIIDGTPHRQILVDGEPAGHYRVDGERRLLRFHVAEPFETSSQELFAHVLGHEEIATAIVATVEPAYLSLCLDVQKRVRVHTYLYHDHERRETAVEGLEDASFDAVEEGELETVEAFERAALGGNPGDWLTGYLENLVARRELFALRRQGELWGIGERRLSDTQPPYADLGVIVAPERRGRGVATHILRRLKGLCYRRGLEPICSTTADNPGARKAIGRAGFASRHRILEVAF